LGEPDKETVLDDAGDRRQPAGQRFRLGDALQRGIEYPVPPVRDESVAILASPERGLRTRRHGPLTRSASEGEGKEFPSLALRTCID